MTLFFFVLKDSPHGTWLIRAANEKIAWEDLAVHMSLASVEIAKLSYKIGRKIWSEDESHGFIGYIS